MSGSTVSGSGAALASSEGEAPVVDQLRAGGWLRAVRGRIGLRIVVLSSFACMLALFFAVAGFTWNQLSLRKHDYAILQVAGQLRVTAESLTQQSRLYLVETRQNGTGGLQWFGAELRRQAAAYDHIINSLEMRDLGPDLTGRDEPIRCNWDAESIAQISRTAATWRLLRERIAPALAPDADVRALLAAAQVLDSSGEALSLSTLSMSGAFKRMMEAKLAFVSQAQFAAAGLGLALVLVLAAVVRRRVLEPLRAAQAGFRRVAQGDLGHQLSVLRDDEIGDMSRTFNTLSLKLRRLFELTQRIGQGVTLPATLDFVRAEFSQLAPVSWVGLLVRQRDDLPGWQLRHWSGSSLGEAPGPIRLDSVLADPKAGHSALAVHRLADAAPESLEAQLAARGFGSALLVPLRDDADGETVLVFATHAAGAYTSEFTELLSNIGAQLRGVLDRTSLTDALVVAAVEGLARLAESRDPETGDHLVRMSLYSAILAEEMGRSGREAGRISAADVADIRRFAPMHDIGKVGISDSILLKPGPLTDEERTEMQRHPLIGAEVLRRCEAQMNAHGRQVFRYGVEIAEGHHERWDGTGYPRRVSGEDIPLAARIVAVADVFDALTSRRPYKEAWSIERARSAIDEQSGRHFDPEAVAALSRAMPRILEVYERLKHI